MEDVTINPRVAKTVLQELTRRFSHRHKLNCRTNTEIAMSCQQNMIEQMPLLDVPDTFTALIPDGWVARKVHEGSRWEIEPPSRSCSVIITIHFSKGEPLESPGVCEQFLQRLMESQSASSDVEVLRKPDGPGIKRAIAKCELPRKEGSTRSLHCTAECVLLVDSMLVCTCVGTQNDQEMRLGEMLIASILPHRVGHDSLGISWSEEFDATRRAEMERVGSMALVMAERELLEAGTFSPFAVTQRQGHLVPIMAAPRVGASSFQQRVDDLRKVLRQDRDDYQATAIVTDAKVMDKDALRVEVESPCGAAVTIISFYARDGVTGSVSFSELESFSDVGQIWDSAGEP